MEALLFANETIISRTEHDEVILTSHRIRYQSSKTNLVSLMLDAITSIEFKYYSQPIFLVISILCLVGAGAALNESESGIATASVVAAGIFGLLYFSSRRHVVKVASASGAFQFVVKGMGTEKVLEFVNKIEEARKNLLKF